MADRRKPGQSLLDYLWTTFKDYAVSGRMEDSPRDYIPTQSLVDKLLKDHSIELFKVVESLPEEGEENKIYLVQSGTDYAAYAFVGSLPILIGNVGGGLELQNKVDELEGKITDLEDNTITGLNAITTTNTDGDTIIKLKLDNTGNVVLSQSNTGLKALVPVDGINSTDTILTLTDKKLSTTLNFTYDEASKKIKLTGVGGVIIGEIDTTDFLIDGMLSGVSFNETTHILTLTFNADSGQEPIEIDLSKLVDVYDGSNIRLNSIEIPTTNAVEPAANDTLDSAVSNLVKKDRELRTAIDRITTNPETLIGTAEVKVANFDTLELSTNLITVDDLWLTTGPKVGYIVKLSNTDNTSLTTEAIVVSVFRYNNYTENTYKCLLQIATSENKDDTPIFRYVWAKIAIARGYGYNLIAEWEVLDANLRLYNKGLTTDYRFTEGAGYSATYPNGAAFSQLKALGLDTGYIVPVTVVNLSSTTPERRGFYQDGVITISDINGVVTYQIEYQEGSSPQAELKKLKEVNFNSLLKGLVFETGPNPGYTFIVGEEIDSNRILYLAIHSLGLSDAIIPVKIHDFTSKESPLGFYDIKNDCIYTSDDYGFRQYSVLLNTVELTEAREWTDLSIHLVTDDSEMNFLQLELKVSQPTSLNLTYPVIVDDTLLETTEPGIYCSSTYGGRLVITFGVNGIRKYDVIIEGAEDGVGKFILNRILPDPMLFKPIMDAARMDMLDLRDISNPAQLSDLNLVSGAIYDILFGVDIIGKLFVSGGTSVRDGLTLTAFGKLEILTEISSEGVSTTLMKGSDFSICVANYDMVSDKYEWKAYNNSYTREETDKLINDATEFPIVYYADPDGGASLTDELKQAHIKILESYESGVIGRTIEVHVLFTERELIQYGVLHPDGSIHLCMPGYDLVGAITINPETGETEVYQDTLKKQLELDQVDNTSDLDKPISTATQTALDTKADKADLDKVEDTVNLLVTIGSVEYVDLGLPSGLLWATCNLGASTSEEAGDMSYKFTSSDDFDTDENVKLEKDPAHLAYGGDWRMPSEDDYLELNTYCTCKIKQENDRSILEVTSKSNGNILRIPANNTLTNPSTGRPFWNINTITRDKISNTGDSVNLQGIQVNFSPPSTYSLSSVLYTGFGAFIRPVTTNPINPNKLTTISKIDSYTVNGKKIINNPTLSKSDIGLASVDNTSDLNKPISTATLTALDSKVNTSDLDAYKTTVNTSLETKANISDLSNVLAEDVVDSDTLTGVDIIHRDTLKKDLFIDLWNTAAGYFGSYNSNTGYFELNGLTDITYEEALDIFIASMPYMNMRINTNAADSYNTPIKPRTYLHLCLYRGTINFSYNLKLEVLNFCPYCKPGKDGLGWYNNNNIRKIVVSNNSPLGFNSSSVIAYNSITFNNLPSLEDVHIKLYNTDVPIKDSPNLTFESVKYLVDNSLNTEAVTVTVHPDVYAKLTDTSNTEWNQVMQDAVAKQITFATAS